MSGAICPRCSCPSLSDIDDPSIGVEPVQCQFCGWKFDAKGLSRKELGSASYNEWSEKLRRLREGSLFLIMVTADEQLNPQVVGEIRTIVRLKSTSYQIVDGLILLCLEFDSKPSDAMISKLRKVVGVVDVVLRSF